MSDVSKRINIDDNRSILCLNDGNCFSIIESFCINGKVKRSYTLSRYDDYTFYAWTKRYKKIKTMSFSFEMNHLLYMPLFHLLNYDQELIIDDDHTVELNRKCIHIFRKNNIIYVTFKNYLEYESQPNVYDKFNVFIKNIKNDGRSKINSFASDTKERLYAFFEEAEKRLIEGDTQITFEELLLLNSFDFKTLEDFYKVDYKTERQRIKEDI